MITKEQIEQQVAENRAKAALLKAYHDACQCGDARDNLWWHSDKQEVSNTPPRRVPEGWEPGMEVE